MFVRFSTTGQQLVRQPLSENGRRKQVLLGVFFIIMSNDNSHSFANPFAKPDKAWDTYCINTGINRL